MSKVKTLKNYSGASNGQDGLGPDKKPTTITGRAARRAHGDTRKRNPLDPTTVRGKLDLAARGFSQGAHAIMQPPISYRTSKTEHRKRIKKYIRKLQRQVDSDVSN